MKRFRGLDYMTIGELDALSFKTLDNLKFQVKEKDMVNVNIANKEVMNLRICKLGTTEPVMYFDRANVTSTALTADRTFATGGWGAPPRVGFNGTTTGTLTVETQITPMKLFALIAGTDIEDSAEFPVREVLTAIESGGDLSVTLRLEPADSGVYVYAVGDEGGTNLAGAVTGGTVVVEGGEPDTEYVVFYMHLNPDGQSVSFKGSIDQGSYTVYADTWYKGETGIISDVVFAYWKAMPQTTFSISHSATGDPGSISIVFDLFVNEKNNLMNILAADQA